MFNKTLHYSENSLEMLREIRLEGTKINVCSGGHKNENPDSLLALIQLRVDRDTRSCTAVRRQRLCAVSLLQHEFGSLCPSESEG